MPICICQVGIISVLYGVNYCSYNYSFCLQVGRFGLGFNSVYHMTGAEQYFNIVGSLAELVIYFYFERPLTSNTFSFLC